MRIVHVIARLNVGGAALHVLQLAHEQAQRGHDVVVVAGTLAAGEESMEYVADELGVELYRLPVLQRELSPHADSAAILALRRIIGERRPQVLHTHTAKAGATGRLAALISGRARPRAVVHTYHGHVLRGYFGTLKTAFFRRLETALNRVTDVAITVSAALRDDLAEMGVAPRSKIRVVPLGLDLARFNGPQARGGLRAACAAGEGDVLIGVVGRLVPIKDIDCFLEAAARVGTSAPHARFAIVGDGERRAALEQKAAALGLGPRTTFVGWRKDLESVYADLDVVVNSSRNEGTPVALIEAMAAGRPVVATAVGGTADLLGDGERGLLVPAASPSALAEAILRTLTTTRRADRRRTRRMACPATRKGLERSNVPISQRPSCDVTE